MGFPTRPGKPESAVLGLLLVQKVESQGAAGVGGAGRVLATGRGPKGRLLQRMGRPHESCFHSCAGSTDVPHFMRDGGGGSPRLHVHSLSMGSSLLPWAQHVAGNGSPVVSSWTKAVCEETRKQLGSGAPVLVSEVSTSGWCSQCRTCSSRSRFHGNSSR